MVVGYLALGNAPVAKSRLRDYQVHHPQEPNGLLLQALADYQRGVSEDRVLLDLQNISAGFPEVRSLAELNTGILLAKMDRGKEAEAILRKVAEREDGELGRRAEQELLRF